MQGFTFCPHTFCKLLLDFVTKAPLLSIGAQNCRIPNLCYHWNSSQPQNPKLVPELMNRLWVTNRPTDRNIHNYHWNQIIEVRKGHSHSRGTFLEDFVTQDLAVQAAVDSNVWVLLNAAIKSWATKGSHEEQRTWQRGRFEKVPTESIFYISYAYV